MSAIATVLAAMGHTVTGSDLRRSPVTDRLASQGIVVAIGHRAEQVGEADLVTASPAVAPDNPELAGRPGPGGCRWCAGPTMLAAIAAARRCLAVAGTHGKTTTASMLSLMLVEAGLRPSFLIGADVGEVGTNAVWDEGEWLVLEADESYGTFEALSAEIALLTNVEPDHLDHYRTFEALTDAFGRSWPSHRDLGRGGRRPGGCRAGPPPRGPERRPGRRRRLAHDRPGHRPQRGGLRPGRTGRAARPPDPGGARPAQRPQRRGLAAVGRPGGRGALRRRGRGPGPLRRGPPALRIPRRGRWGDLRRRLRPPAERGARRAGHGAGWGLGPGGLRLPAPPLHPHRCPGRRPSARPSTTRTWWW